MSKSIIQTKDADITDAELEKLISYGIREAGFSESRYEEYKKEKYSEKIIKTYHEMCSLLENHYVYGKLDTFLRAACLMISCFTNGVFKMHYPLCYNSDEVNALIGVEAALLWIQNPYWYVGFKGDERFEASKCDFEDIFQNNPTFLEDRKQNLVNSLIFGCEFNSPISFGEHLYLLYQSALCTKDENLLYLQAYKASIISNSAKPEDKCLKRLFSRRKK